MKANNHNDKKLVDIESQIIETDIPINNTSIIPFTRNIKLIVSFILFQAVIVLSMVFMLNHNDNNTIPINYLQRTPLSSTETDSVAIDPEMQPYVKWTKDATIALLTDFEYDDIVLIGSLLMNAMENLSEDSKTPNLNSIIDNLQIVYFASNDAKKDAKGLWTKKLAMAHYFFPESVFKKIVIRWRDSDEPQDFQEWSSRGEYEYNAETFVGNMKETVDMIVITGGHGNLNEMYEQMMEQEKTINRFMMSVGGVNPREDQTTEEDMDAMFKWAAQSVNKKFVDSSRFPWMGLRDPGQVHELGGKREMEELLKKSGGYDIVMEYFSAFNLGLVYNGPYPNIESKPELEALKTQLQDNGFHTETFTALCHQIIQDPDVTTYLTNPEDPMAKKNWNLVQMGEDDFWAVHKMKKVLSYLNGESQDGPAADPVIAYWHWFANEHKVVPGTMMKGHNIEFTKEETKQWGLFNSGFRMMISHELFDEIQEAKNDLFGDELIESRGEMVQIQLKQKYGTSREFVEHYQLHWRQMFEKFLSFRGVPAY